MSATAIPDPLSWPTADELVESLAQRAAEIVLATLPESVDVLDYFHSATDGRDESRFLTQLPLGGRCRCLAGLHAARNDVPVPALRR